MKKMFLLLVCLCLLGTAAFAEAPALNWADLAAEEVAEMGQFQQLELTGLPTIAFWIPSNMSVTDVGEIEGPFQPTALFATDDGNYAVAVFVAEVTSIDEYVTMMETQGGGSAFVQLTVNGVDCVGYEVAEANMECLIYPVSENVILTFSCTPANGDEEWDATKGVIFTSIQPVE